MKLSLIDQAFLLKKTPLFHSLTLDLLLPIADKLAIAAFDKGDEIFHCGEEAHRMYFVSDGKIELSADDRAIILEKECFFGDEALFNDSRRCYRARCLTDALLLTLSQINLLTIISECPAVALGFLSVYATTLPQRSLHRQGKGT